MRIETCVKIEHGEPITYFYPAKGEYKMDSLIGLGIGADGCVKRLMIQGRNGSEYGEPLYIRGDEKPDAPLSIPLKDFIIRWLRYETLTELQKKEIAGEANAMVKHDIMGAMNTISKPATSTAPKHIGAEDYEAEEMRLKLGRLFEHNFWNAFPLELRDALIQHEKEPQLTPPQTEVRSL